MRSHSQIVREYGATALRHDLRTRGIEVHASTPQRWADRNSIPGPFWADIVALGAASLDELANAARASNSDTAQKDAA